jgi:hypothetical protein
MQVCELNLSSGEYEYTEQTRTPARLLLHLSRAATSSREGQTNYRQRTDSHKISPQFPPVLTEYVPESNPTVLSGRILLDYNGAIDSAAGAQPSPLQFRSIRKIQFT